MTTELVVAYQGCPGSFSHKAATIAFPSASSYLGTDHFRHIFDHLASGRVSRGVVPIENTLAGSVYEIFDLMERYKICIVGEQQLSVSHFLFGVSASASLTQLKKVYSHPKALEQCRAFFEKNPHIEQCIFSDTAGAARHVAASGDITLGAIASKEAGQLYKLHTIQAQIEDNSQNFTRFLTIARAEEVLSTGNKCSLMVTLLHQKGSLARVLSVVADQGLNLSKIESRPIPGKPFEYRFYIDIELAGVNLNAALAKVRPLVEQLTMLGVYSSAH